jgi:3-phenylpropionate/trans-cinnamate dioxygenase ferredoxin component
MRPTVRFDSIPPDSAVRCEIGAAKLLVVRVGEEAFAISRICTHAAVELAAGPLTPECWVECPMHGAMFDPATGAVEDGPAKRPIKTYPTAVIKGVVHVEVGEDAEPPAEQPDPSTPGARPSLAGWGGTA